jgi:tetratricopeptide (TPR) repeat protein
VQCFIKVIDIDPAEYTAWYLLGRCYMGTAQYTDAFEAYSRAVNLNPNDSEVWCSLGVLYYSFGQYRESLGMFCRAVKLNPTLSDAWYNIGALYDMCDQPEDAQKAYVKAKECGLSERFNNSHLISAATLNNTNNTGSDINSSEGHASSSAAVSTTTIAAVDRITSSASLYPQPVNYPESSVLLPLIVPGGSRSSLPVSTDKPVFSSSSSSGNKS